MAHADDEDEQLRSVALQNASSILLARQRAEEELLRTKEALAASEERLRAIFNQAAVGIALAGLDGRFVEMNRRFSDVLGYSVDELRGMSFQAITHPDDLTRTMAAVGELLDGSRTEYTMEKRYVRKDGGVLWSLTTVTLLRDPSGAPQRFIGVIEDISRRKRAEEALREETRNLELLNETGRALAAKLDLQPLLQAVTDAATQLSGAAFGAFFYNIIDDGGEAFLLYTLSGAPREAFEQFGKPRATALFGPTFRGEGVIRCDDVRTDPRYGRMGPHHGMPEGHLPVRSYMAVPVHSRTGDVIGGLFFGHPEPGVFTERAERLVVGVAAQAGIAVDNARLYEGAQAAAEERRALLERERAARSAAERMSDLKDEFLATLSHELRTPLNAILGWSRVLIEGPQEPADVRKGLETIARNARLQTQLIDDLLDMSRITSGKLRLDIETVHPQAVVEAAVETVRPSADAKGIRLETSIDPEVEAMAGDSARLQQVVWNLLSNAIKFTSRGGLVQLIVEPVAAHLEIRVADTGVGIKPEFVPHLFERFRQGDASTTRQYGGLGLGLSIVKSLVELHGGTVSVTSPGENLGTVVTVRLPLGSRVPAVDGQAGLRRSAGPDRPAAPGPRALEGVRVLVVDDQADALDLIRRVLEDSAAEVMTTGTADEAIRLLEQRRPHVLVSDIGMPDADGFELIRRVRDLGASRGGDTPAIAVTAFARPEDRTRALREGFGVHVAKPLDPSELVATVARMAGRAGKAS